MSHRDAEPGCKVYIGGLDRETTKVSVEEFYFFVSSERMVFVRVVCLCVCACVRVSVCFFVFCFSAIVYYSVWLDLFFVP